MGVRHPGGDHLVVRIYGRMEGEGEENVKPEDKKEIEKLIESMIVKHVNQSLSNILPKALPNVLPKTLPKVLPEVLPGVLPEVLPKVLPSALPTIVPRLLPDASPLQKGIVWLRNNLGGTAIDPRVKGITIQDGTSLPIGSISDGQFLKRSGNTIVGASGGGGGIGLEDVYPVGSIYISVVSTNPATLFGMGTWVAFGTGRVLVGINPADPDFDTVEKTSGAKTVQASAQTFAGTPSTAAVNHVHVQSMPSSFSGTQAYLGSDTTTTGSKASPLSTANPTGGVASYTPEGTNTPGAATSVVQPSITVYAWKRTA